MKLNDYTALVRVEAFNDDSNETYEENLILTNVSDFTEAMIMLQEYYGMDIEVIHDFTLLDGPFLRISDEAVEKILKDEL